MSIPSRPLGYVAQIRRVSRKPSWFFTSYSPKPSDGDEPQASTSKLESSPGRRAPGSRSAILDNWHAWREAIAERRASFTPPQPVPEVFRQPVTRRTQSRNTAKSSARSPAQPSGPELLQAFRENRFIPTNSIQVERLAVTVFDESNEEEISQFLDLLARDEAGVLSMRTLSRLLARPVEQEYHAHKEWEALLQWQSPAPDSRKMSRAVFLKCWRLVWRHYGENNALDSTLAASILRTLLDLPAEVALNIHVGAEAEFSALRFLLFQAGLEDHPDLALDLMTHLISPYALVSLPHSVDPPRYKPSSAADEDIPVLLHDLLRSGIISQAVIKEFDLTQAVQRMSDGPVADFNRILRQLLLRMIIRSNANLHRYDEATLLLRFLEPLRDTLDAKQAYRDVKLIHDVCEAALKASAVSGKWVNRVGFILSQAMSGRTLIWKTREMRLIASPKLLKLFFDTALPEFPLAGFKRLKHIPAGLVWEGICASTVIRDYQPTMSQVIRLLRFFSDGLLLDPATPLMDGYFPHPTKDTQYRQVLITLKHLRRRFQSESGECTSATANWILRVGLTARPSEPSPKMENLMARNTLGLFHLLDNGSIQLMTPFTLETENLVPLVRLVLRLPDTQSMTREQQANQIIHRFLNDRRHHRQLSEDDLSAVIVAFFANGDRAAALRVFTLLLRTKRVPSRQAVYALLRDLRASEPQLAEDILKELERVGLRLGSLRKAERREKPLAAISEIAPDTQEADEDDYDFAFEFEKLQASSVNAL